jgi:hypothetical protein
MPKETTFAYLRLGKIDFAFIVEGLVVLGSEWEGKLIKEFGNSMKTF